MSRNTIFVPIGYELTLTTDANSSGFYEQLPNPGGSKNTPVAIAVSSNVALGPFNDNRYYALDTNKGTISYSLAQSGVYSSTDDDNLDLKAPIDSPTFTGTPVLPSTTDLDSITSKDNLGTAATNVSAVEYGDGFQHTTVLTVTNAVLPAITGGGDEAEGVLLYTLPAGACVVDKAYMSLAIQQQDGNITSDTPDGGLGTLQATGNQATLDSLGAGYEDILTGQTFNDCDGTAEVKTVANQVKVIESGDAHTVYFNVADGWAASGDTGPLVSGTVVLHWQFMN